ncbi:MAG: 3-deoxy-D-manno-octulosonic acid transferase [Acidobacteria bacterium]|nr:3-deoxy-D-manno-octulosonic acid transferase [Acidobacteriota bacterium]
MGRLPGLTERLGSFPANLPAGSGPTVWFHAVSLGEMKVAAFLAEQLRSHVAGLRVILTASTRTGHDEASRRATVGDIVLYPPLDYAWLCRRFLKRWKPDVVVVMETELWPNLLRAVKGAGAGLVLANGRISDRSLPRYRATRFFWRRVLSYPDAFFVQSERDAERFAMIGAPSARIHVTGNLKFAIRPSESPLSDALSSSIREAPVGPVLVAGSTMPGEETHLLHAFLALRHGFPDLWMILAPRHPERAAAIATEINSAGIPCQFRSRWHAGKSIAPGIFLLDSTGELADLYQLATAAFIGGTLVPTGGHNILEPAHFACPTVIGPSMQNFQEIAAQFLKAGAIIQVENPLGLVPALRQLFLNPEDAKRIGEAARALLERQMSGLAPILEELGRRLGGKIGNAPAAPVISHPAAAGAGRWK